MGELLVLLAAMAATGVVAGMLAGLLGVGGGIVTVPVLEFALGLAGVDAAVRMHIAVATSLAIIIPTSVVSARAHHRRDAVDLRIARLWGPWIFVGALAGTWVASRADGRVLAGIFGALALLVAARMILQRKEVQFSTRVPDTQRLAPVPALIGFVSSMVGIGGGSLSVPVMTLLGEPIHRAVGTSALFGLLIAIPGTLGFIAAGYGHPLLPPASVGYVNLIALALVAPTTVIAAPYGARLAHAMNRRQLGVLFGLFLLVVSVRMLMRALQP